MTEQTDLPEEFTEKRQALAEFLLTMATGYSWVQADGVDNFHFNYMADADEIIKANPHLLGLETREKMGLWLDEDHKQYYEEVIVPNYCERDVELTLGFYEAAKESMSEFPNATRVGEEAEEDIVLISKPSELPDHTFIQDKEYGQYFKDPLGVWVELFSDCDKSGSHNAVPNDQADAVFKDFDILAAPLGWEPPGVNYYTLEYYNHELGRMERKTLMTTYPERKPSDEV